MRQERHLLAAAVAVVVLLVLLLRSSTSLVKMAGGDSTNNALIAIAVIVRRDAAGQFSVRTQVRHVQNTQYDPMYDNTLEAVGETVKVDEPIVDAVKRGVHEEVGLDLDTTPYAVFGHRATQFVSTRERSQNSLDKYHVSENPYIFVQTLKGPQPWVGLGFVVLVPPKSPATIGRGDGEADGAVWWDAKELLVKLESRAEFMGFHYPVFKRVCMDLQSASSDLRKSLDNENIVNTW